MVIAAALLGFCFGITMMLILGFYLSGKEPYKTTYDDLGPLDKNTLKKAIEDIELAGSIKYRFKKADEITAAQLKLMKQTEQPSKSAAHSRYKNGLIGQFKTLEEEKMAIFRSILEDGVDPMMNLVADGKTTKVRMSEIVAMYDNKQASKSVPPTDSKSTGKKRSLQLVVDNSGSKNDQTTHPSDPTIH